jgi:hypothetical protein
MGTGNILIILCTGKGWSNKQPVLDKFYSILTVTGSGFTEVNLCGYFRSSEPDLDPHSTYYEDSPLL